MAASITEELNSLWTSTWPHWKKEIIDAVFMEQNPLFYWMSQKGRLQKVKGGRNIRFPLETDINPTIKEIGRNGEVDLTDVDPLTTVQFDWATLAGNVMSFRKDQAENASSEQMFNLSQKKVDNLKKSTRKTFEELLFRDVSAIPDNGFNSIKKLVHENPTNSLTVGNYNQQGHDWWQNQSRSSSGTAAAWLRKDMQQLFYDIEDVEESPDIILGNRDAYGTYEDDLLGMSYFDNKKLADAGFEHLVYKGKPLMRAQNCDSGKLYMINSDYFYIVVNSNMYFERTDWKEITNQPFNYASQLVLKGQVMATNRRALGVLTGITY